MSAFRIVTILVAVIPLFFGGSGVLGGARGMAMASGDYAALNVTALDNQFRYLSGIYVGIAGMLFWSAGDVKGRAQLFRWAIIAIFIGGCARTVSWMMEGQPPIWQVAGMAIELGAPILLYWQARVLRDGSRISV